MNKQSSSLEDPQSAEVGMQTNSYLKKSKTVHRQITKEEIGLAQKSVISISTNSHL